MEIWAENKGNEAMLQFFLYIVGNDILTSFKHSNCILRTVEDTERFAFLLFLIAFPR